jgi:hypothetical protein
MLELHGKRVDSIEEAPPLAASVAAERVPGFLSVNTPISSHVSAQRAVEWFRQGYLQLSEEEEEEEVNDEHVPYGGIKRLAFQVKKKGGRVFSKIRAASTLEQSNTN